MAQIANLVVLDRPGTAHTFSPFTKDANGVYELREPTGVPLADAKCTLSARTNASGKYIVKGKFTIPVTQTQTINGVSSPVVVRTAYGEVTLTFDAASSKVERSSAARYVSGLLDLTENNWVWDKVIGDASGIYG